MSSTRWLSFVYFPWEPCLEAKTLQSWFQMIFLFMSGWFFSGSKVVSNQPFSGAFAVSFREGTWPYNDEYLYYIHIYIYSIQYIIGLYIYIFI